MEILSSYSQWLKYMHFSADVHGHIAMLEEAEQSQNQKIQEVTIFTHTRDPLIIALRNH